MSRVSYPIYQMGRGGGLIQEIVFGSEWFMGQLYISAVWDSLPRSTTLLCPARLQNLSGLRQGNCITPSPDPHNSSSDNPCNTCSHPTPCRESRHRAAAAAGTAAAWGAWGHQHGQDQGMAQRWWLLPLGVYCGVTQGQTINWCNNTLVHVLLFFLQVNDHTSLYNTCIITSVNPGCCEHMTRLYHARALSQRACVAVVCAASAVCANTCVFISFALSSWRFANYSALTAIYFNTSRQCVLPLQIS